MTPLSSTLTRTNQHVTTARQTIPVGLESPGGEGQGPYNPGCAKLGRRRMGGEQRLERGKCACLPGKVATSRPKRGCAHPEVPRKLRCQTFEEAQVRGSKHHLDAPSGYSPCRTTLKKFQCGHLNPSNSHSRSVRREDTRCFAARTFSPPASCP